MDSTETGKISGDFFKTSLYPFLGHTRKEVIVGPGYGIDVAITALPNGYEMALTSDPLSYIPSLGLMESAWLSVHLMANDMATTGVAPQYAQFVLNLPASITSNEFNEYWQHIHTFCEAIEVAITGGHTGRYEGLNATIAGGGTMIAIEEKGKFLSARNAMPGDHIVVTKESALSASSILAMSFPETVKDHCGTEIYYEACQLFYKTTCLKEGLIASSLNSSHDKAVTAMHDVTECGILGAIYEMAVAANCGVDIDYAALPVGHVQKSICQFFEIDPLYSVGAGAIIMAVHPGKTDQLISLLKENGIAAACVGKFTNRESGLNLHQNGGTQAFTHPGTDPYWKAFFQAFHKGLK